MTRAEILDLLAALERRREERVEIWFCITEPDGTVSKRIYRGSFVPTREPRNDTHAGGKT